MAQLNMMGGAGHWNMHPSAGWNGNGLGGSNISLNMPQHGFDQPMWNPWMQQLQMMPPMMGGELEMLKFFTRIIFNSLNFFSHTTAGIPPRSRNHSRAASPALSIRSRRSMMSSRSRQKYQPADLTDDEDSDIEQFTDDSRSRSSRRPASLHGDAMRSHRRHRHQSETRELDHHDAEVINRIQKMKEKSKFIRERRSGSLTNWPTTRAHDSGSLSPSDEEIHRSATKYHSKQSLTSPLPQHKKKQHYSGTDSDDEKELRRRQKSSSTTTKIQSTAMSKASKEPVDLEITKESKSEQPTNSTTSEFRPLKVIKSPTPPPTPPPAIIEQKFVQKVEQKIESERPAAVNGSDKQQIEIPLVAWECEHCTFVNDATSKICTICCKTRVEVLETLPPSVDDDLDVKAISESIMRNENDDSDSKQKGKVRKISFLPGTKAH